MGNGIVNAAAFTSLIRTNLAKHLQTLEKFESVRLHTIIGSSEQRCSPVPIKISLDDGKEVTEVLNTLPLPKVFDAKAKLPFGIVLFQLTQLKNVLLAVQPGNSVTLLVDNSVIEAHWVLGQRRSGRNDPYSNRTQLKWVICGLLDGGQLWRVELCTLRL